MLFIYSRNTKMKTGWLVTESILGPESTRYSTVKLSHPQAQNAELLMLAMSRYFRECTNMRSRPTLKQAFEGSLQFLANAEDYKYLSATSAARERILVK